ncbi:uncharacterized protein LOC105662583 [Megachile rotundata]|uniref:uncharacterized protein LOC105662583 n=1 Tax=Megachile rotundata TaxID=143995 RepID=UPI000614E0F8|nr:PREDICTED: uncharacterized protein LOC105662583 [Megachile rotundata]
MYRTPEPERSRPQIDIEESPNQATSNNLQQNFNSDGQDSIEVARVVKLPPFWKENPILWFKQVEAAFAVSRITNDDSRFRYVILNLEQAVLPIVSDILESPPDFGKYEALKNRIISVLAETNESRLRKLLHGHDLGDEKPSVFLQKMRHLASGQCSDSVLRSLFLEQMPSNIRTILTISETPDLSKLALQADKIIEMTRGNNISSVDPVNSISNLVDKDSLAKQVAELKSLVETLSVDVNRNRDRFRHHSKYRHRSNSRRRYNNFNNYNSNNNHNLQQVCFFHKKFGKLARKCQQPCNFGQEEENYTSHRQ